MGYRNLHFAGGEVKRGEKRQNGVSEDALSLEPFPEVVFWEVNPSSLSQIIQQFCYPLHFPTLQPHLSLRKGKSLHLCKLVSNVHSGDDSNQTFLTFLL